MLSDDDNNILATNQSSSQGQIIGPPFPFVNSFTMTFTEAGTYDYFCALHPWMTGQVIVSDSSVIVKESSPSESDLDDDDEDDRSRSIFEDNDEEEEEEEENDNEVGCDPSYPDMCIESPPPDLDCGDVSEENFTVREPDPHGFDNDNDGIGCES